MPEEKQPVQNQTPKSSGDSDTLMGVLAYLGILCLIPLFAAKDSAFAQYHAKQGLTLFALEAVVSVVYFLIIPVAVLGGGIFALLMPLLWLVNIGCLVLSIIGIVNVINKKQQPLPLIGGIHLMK